MMTDLPFSRWGVRVYWTTFGLLLIGLCIATFSQSGIATWLGVAEPKPWIRFWGKWIIGIGFFPAMFLAYTVAALFDHATARRRLAAERHETFQLS